MAAAEPGALTGTAESRSDPDGRRVRLEQALRIVNAVVEAARGPVSVFVADGHGELVAAATMDGAPHDTRLNVQRKAYTPGRRVSGAEQAIAAAGLVPAPRT